MTLVFIRHGQAVRNATGVIGGWRDYPLTDLGRDQARRAAVRLAATRVDTIYASNLSRASETARIIAAASNIEVVENAALRERSWGDAEGLTRHQIAERFGHGTPAARATSPTRS
ncbi:MAG: histidine phosphatase family protein [Chloroflexi bacterium]|nr:histidine phosphatase family protein [Chloroflexota bacterium]